MADDGISSLIGPGGDTWNLPDGEAKRQAVASLRGYAYQLHRTVAAWLQLKRNGYLFLEAAEDYASLSRDPSSRDEILAATQVKDTRESGSVTLNSADVLDAIRNFWRYREANVARKIQLTFLTTSQIGKERKNGLPSGTRGLDAWQIVGRGSGDLAELKAALQARFDEAGSLGQFLKDATDEDIRELLLKPIQWSCGELDYADIVERNREDIIEVGLALGGTVDQSERALDTLLHEVLNTIVLNKERRLTYAGLAKLVQEANTIRVPIARAFSTGVDLDITGSWVPSDLALPAKLARRSASTADVAVNFRERRRLWLHGANGMGKSTLAALVAGAQGGNWQALRLRGTAAGAAAERIAAARQALGRMPDVSGLVLDDLTVDHETQIVVPLRALGTTLSREGLACVISSNNPPGRALREALGLEAMDVVEAPDFSDEDAAELVAQYGGNPATWAKFVKYAGGFGHPQLVHVVVAGMAARGWPEDELETWLTKGFDNQDVAAERRATRRRLLEELGGQEVALLSRLAKVGGAFDRQVVEAIASVEPVIQSAKITVEKLSGYWIERVGDHRFRVSPLVADLPNHLLGTTEQKALDSAIGRSIIFRNPLAGDLLDTGFMHALVAKDDAALNQLAIALTQAQGDVVKLLSGAMPFFRDYLSRIGEVSYRPPPIIAALLGIARHRLLVTRGDRGELNESVRYILSLVELAEAEAAGVPLKFMALSQILHPQESLGLIDGWFNLLRQMDSEPAGRIDLQGIFGSSTAALGIDPISFLFMAHALHLPGLSELETLFSTLSELTAAERQRWLSATKHDRAWSMLIVDNAWLKHLQAGTLDWSVGANTYANLADIALAWGEDDIAARCYRNQAVLIDEYGHDHSAALKALDAADARLPQNLDLARQRAKIAWRAGEYEAALKGLAAIEDWLKAGDAIEAAFAFREAAMSAGELGLWRDSESYFLKAHDALLKVQTDQEAFKLGLLIDAIGVRYKSGDTEGAVRGMVDLVGQLAERGAGKSPKDHAVAALGRHFVLWLRSQKQRDIQIDDQPVVYFIGAISNPEPHSDLEKWPIPEPASLWFLFGLVALEEGIPWTEIAGWQGIKDLASYADLYVQLPMGRLERAVANIDLDEFTDAAPEAAAAIAYFSEARKTDPRPDPVAPAKVSMPPFGAHVLGSDAARPYVRDAAIAFAINLATVSPFQTTELERIAGLLPGLESSSLVPEWFDGSIIRDDLRSHVASLALEMACGKDCSLDETLLAHLRLWEWLQASHFKRACLDNICRYARDFWAGAVVARRFEMKTPYLAVPEIERALAGYEVSNKWLATLLLAAHQSTRVSLAAEYRTLLVEAKD
ncbi:hypothetical protein GCM10010869_16470 [Mesorhizobium tianshanense]|uniref:Uncharacterized protein n=1 Tax=Mesorhizobium tianshanense TaxID=39844 RepID=A0A562NW08_9HYPH|nr:hypothetical protein [Mesorhizobium tianshanense]TWI36402.1 hypothetical protein IQ26_02915 [Mesorhizobium tianshanense]GLS36058.1 hypothetical protein GCM10010869_16470 [Mesorhizobium tianshanense]